VILKKPIWVIFRDDHPKITPSQFLNIFGEVSFQGRVISSENKI